MANKFLKRYPAVKSRNLKH